MAQKRKRRPSRQRKVKQAPGWVWGLFGLAIGLTVALAIYIKDRSGGVARPAARTASVVADERDSPPPEATEVASRKPRYEFYDMLPRFEVIVPEEDHEVRAETLNEALADPGVYELQTGSFGELADADRMRAELALLGIESRIQRVSIDEKTYHRVRVGPIDDLERLNVLRGRLREAGVDALSIRLAQ